jgi:hypothetical protein
MKSHRLTATLVLVVLAIAPLALAQTGKPKKKGSKADAAASASVSASAAAAPVDTTPPPAPSAAPEASASASALPDTPPEAVPQATDTKEDPSKTYYFVGLRYRGDVIPQFLVNAFVNGGGTFYSNMVAAELDIRKDSHTIMPWLAFANYGFGNTLFENNGNGTGPGFAGNWTVVNSGLSAIYVGMDELWSTSLDEAHHWDFEYGFGFGLGVVFGSLGNNWVHTLTGTQISPSNYALCQTVNDGTGCALADHQNATTAKVGGYQESAGLLGPKPILFPYLAIPQVGLRWKPVKQFEARLNVGFSLTGFFFSLGADYGLEKTEAEDPATTAPKKASDRPGWHGTL